MLSTAARNLGSRSFATTSAAGKKFDLTGIYPPVTTPFNADETPAWDRLGENLTKYAVEAPQLRGYLVQGSNGEYCYMSAEERVEMVRKASLHTCAFCYRCAFG
jgi:4-hydroxy-2-oxoglutarate aldolase